MIALQFALCCCSTCALSQEDISSCRQNPWHAETACSGTLQAGIMRSSIMPLLAAQGARGEAAVPGAAAGQQFPTVWQRLPYGGLDGPLEPVGSSLCTLSLPCLRHSVHSCCGPVVTAPHLLSPSLVVLRAAAMLPRAATAVLANVMCWGSQGVSRQRV